MRSATVYLRRQQFLIHASSKTTDGVWVLSEPCLAIPGESDDEALGQAVKSALEGSRSGIPHPTDFKAVLAPLLRVAGVKSWSTFMKGTTSATADEDGSRVTLLPMKNAGAAGGFQGEEKDQIVLERPTLRELGAALRAATTAVH